MGSQEIQRNQGIQVISRAADVLRLLGKETDGLSLGQIAKQVDLPRSTVQRIVSALAHEGFVSADNGYGGIRLGPEIRSLAEAVTTDIKDKLRPVMQQISDATGETVDLAMLEGNKMLFIDQIVGTQRLRTVSSIGEAFPLTTTANGKAALACLDQVKATKLILAEVERGENSKPLSEITSEVDLIRGGDLARDDGEHTEGISALGFGVKEPNGDILAISVPVPSSRFGRIEGELARAISEIKSSADI